jgi:hypothetical protein
MQEGHLSVLFAPSTRGVLMPTLRQTHVIASHMGTSSVDRALLLPMRRVNNIACVRDMQIEHSVNTRYQTAL